MQQCRFTGETKSRATQPTLLPSTPYRGEKSCTRHYDVALWFAGEITTLHTVAALVLQGRLQHYTLSVTAAVLQGRLQHYTLSVTATVLQGRLQHYTISVTAAVLQGRLQHYTMLQQWFTLKEDYNTTQCCGNSSQGRLQRYTLLQQWFAGETATGEYNTTYCRSSSLQGRLQDYTLLQQ